VAELDRDALGRRRRITRPLALAVLDRMEAADGGGPNIGRPNRFDGFVTTAGDSRPARSVVLFGVVTGRIMTGTRFGAEGSQGVVGSGVGCRRPGYGGRTGLTVS
jgi:hypothetical protein